MCIITGLAITLQDWCEKGIRIQGNEKLFYFYSKNSPST
jgi:hypothetical protein